MKLSIIIPVFNEQKTIEEILRRVSDVKLPSFTKEIIVVNDCSTDETSQKLRRLQQRMKEIKVVTHDRNKGKGAAIHTGLQRTTGEYVVIQDADLEYNPQDLSRLVVPILKGEADVVYGTRLNRFPDFHWRFRFLLHYFGNRFLSLVTSVLYGTWITDMETCYKIFPKKALKKFKLEGNGFNFEPEITAKLLKNNYRLTELPIVSNPRGYEEGKKLKTFPEGFKAIWTLLKYRFIS